ncbi:transporter substrate-binding domain-containing protein [Phyllobacterium zundukense]|uniref:Transporter substrate-binding domain-containing protein n=1 Tax=Phyllobacterium zundukense TaxID=1867719 RepID=A0ACD4CV80_9HYPH|nr:transporter substrate-binding domain-containing protein [Phyllobacterium zundukense]UXN57392.1 transporter substrate-binding domain-containing protein [Phyllobacterium zundukense]
MFINGSFNRLLGGMLAIAILASASITSAAKAADWTVGANIGNVPWEFAEKDGSYTGFEVELVNELGKRLNQTVDIQNLPFEGVIPALLSDRIQIGIASMTITDERLKSLAFAQPYFDADQSVTTLATSSVTDLNGIKGTRVAVESAATSDIWATKNEAEYSFETINRYDSMSSAILDLQAGRVDAYIADMPAIAYYIKDKPQFHIVARIPTGEQYSLIFNKNFADIGAINGAISEMKTDGFLASLHKKWFGTEPAADSSTVVVKPLPAVK